MSYWEDLGRRMRWRLKYETGRWSYVRICGESIAWKIYGNVSRPAMSMKKSILVSRLVDRHCSGPSAEHKRLPTVNSATRFQQCWMARLSPHWLPCDVAQCRSVRHGPTRMLRKNRQRTGSSKRGEDNR